MGNNADLDSVREFLEGTFGDAVNAESQLVLWSARDKRSRWTSSIDEAVSAVGEIARISDPYYGCCLQDRGAAEEERKLRTGKDHAAMEFCRGYAATTRVIPGVWLDLDVANDSHEKVGLPTTMYDVNKILEALPLAPTWIVKTGGGLHVYWLFQEPWILESDTERRRAAAIVQEWQGLAIAASKDLGFVCDSTHDLARVLRPAGTVNTKYGSPVFIQGSEKDNRPRYDPDDFEEWTGFMLTGDAKAGGDGVARDQAGALPTAPNQKRVEKLQGDGVLREDAQPPAEKLMAMINLQAQFAATWRRERNFPSQSEYDMSLAGMAARAGWMDAEICSLVIAHRREGGEDTRTGRPRYFAKLIDKARGGLAAEETHERLSERVLEVQEKGAMTRTDRSNALDDLSGLLGLRIKRVLKFVADPPQYRLILENGAIHLGGVETLLAPGKFRAAIAAVQGHLIQRFKSDAWDPVAQAILQAVEEQDLGADSSVEGIVAEWLGEYLAQHPPAPHLDRADAIIVRSPFLLGEGEGCAIFLSEFKSWLGFHRDEKMGRGQLATLLRAAGCTPRKVACTRDTGAATTANVWVTGGGRGISSSIGKSSAEVEA